MSRLEQFAFRLRALFRKEKLDAGMAEEMRLHLEERTRRNIRAGMKPEDARFAAMKNFGGIEQIKETARDQRGLGRLDEWARDLRFAARSLRRAPGFAAVTVGSLALGFALIATTLAVVNAYLVRSMPYPAANRLYRVIFSAPGRAEPGRLAGLDWAPLRDVVELADSSNLSRRYLHLDDLIREAQGFLAAPDSVAALGVRAVLGRTFTAEEFIPGSEPVAMISHAFWQEQFGGDPSALGQTVRLSPANSGEPPAAFRIIGVLPPGFRYAREFARTLVDFVLPSQTSRQVYMVRLREGVPVAFAEQRINAHVNQFTTPPPNWPGARLESITTSYVRELRPRLFAITAAAALVLLMVAANVAVLMLLRTLRRQKEMAVRVALGAGRRHVARMLGAEIALLCGSALVLGLGLSAATLRILGPLIEDRLGRPAPAGPAAFQLDPILAGIVAGIALVLAFVLSLFPLLAPWQRRLGDSLRSESHGGTDRPSLRRARAGLLVVEVAVSLMLLVGCGLMVRTVVNLIRTDLGHETSRILRARIQLPVRTYPDPAAFLRFHDALAARLAALPDTSFALSNFVPFFQPTPVPLVADAGAATGVRGAALLAGEGYFATLGIALQQGRGFAATDRLGSEPVAIVSETLARQMAPHGSVLGQRLRVQAPVIVGAGTDTWRTIVGVVADVRQTFTDDDFRDVYLPFAQAPTRFGSLLVRTSLAPSRWPGALQTMVTAVDPAVFAAGAPALTESVEQQLAGPRFLLSLLAAFAVSAVLLAFIGLYGVTAYAVRQRERDIAIRIAIGATPLSVERLFLKGAGRVLATGIAVGLIGALALSRVLESQLHGVEPFDPWTLLAGCILLAGIGLLATWWPARRAARVDPMVALRCE